MASSRGTALKKEYPPEEDTREHVQDHLPVPVNVSKTPDTNLGANWGFGEGFRFQYDSHTSQADWAKRKYNAAHEKTTHSNNSHTEFTASADNTHQEILPELVAYNTVHHESELNVYDRLVFAIEMSIRYHSRRHTHYEHVFKLMMFSIILLSAFAFVSASSSRVVLGLCIIGLALGTFVWNITHSSRLHDVIRGEYQSLLENIRLYTHPAAEDIRHWRNQRMRIRAKEPPLFWAVADDCYLETAKHWDIEAEHRDKLPILLQPFKNWFRF